MNSKCQNCQHHSFREMIEKPYGYVGTIPCIGCVHLHAPADNYTPMNPDVRQIKDFVGIQTNMED